MIVACDRCSTKYRVHDSKLPKGGGNIKCPKCAHIFFVEPPKPKAPPVPSSPPSPSPEGGPRRAPAGMSFEVMPSRVGTTPSMLLSSSGGHPAIQERSPVSSPIATPAAMGAAGGEDEAAGWKLKTSFGLIYDFPDTDSLHNWLSGRNQLAGYMLSRDGQVFKELLEFEHLFPESLVHKLREAVQQEQGGDTGPTGTAIGFPVVKAPKRSKEPELKVAEASKPRVTAPLAAASASVLAEAARKAAESTPEPPRSTNKARSTGKVATMSPPASRPRKTGPKKSASAARGPRPVVKKTPVWVAPLSALLVLVFVALTLQLTGVLDFRALLGQKPAPAAVTNLPTNPVPPPTRQNLAAQEEEEAADPSAPVVREVRRDVAPNPFGAGQHVKALVEQARKEMDEGQYEQARDTLNSAKRVAPKEADVYVLLEEVHDRLGDPALSEKARKMHEALNGTGGP